MTVSAEARLRPRPPARVEMRKMKSGLLGALNLPAGNITHIYKYTYGIMKK